MRATLVHGAHLSARCCACQRNPDTRWQSFPTVKFHSSVRFEISSLCNYLKVEVA